MTDRFSILARLLLAQLTILAMLGGSVGLPAFSWPRIGAGQEAGTEQRTMTTPQLRQDEPPPGAAVLFDGTDTAQWQTREGGPAGWPIVDGSLEVCGGCGDIQTVQAFGDFRLHVEFWLPASPPEAGEQERGNSGIYLQRRYELQVLDSHGRELGGRNDGGALYGLADAEANAALPPEAWQSYDVTFRAARWTNGTKVENARVTAVWNGVTVHRERELPSPTAGGDPGGPEAGPILLQDHGQPVRYRNLWVERLD